MESPDFEISVECDKNNSDKSTTACFTGELTIGNSLHIYNKILNEILPHKNVELTVKEPVNMDISFVQILVSLIISRKKKDRKTSIIFELDNANTDLLTKTGIIETIELLQK